MLSLLLGWRAFVRHKRRSIITAAAVSFSLAMMLVFAGLADDAHARMAELGIRMGAGHVLVQGKGYQEELSSSLVVPDPALVVRAARAIPTVTEAVMRVRTTGLMSAGELSAAVMVSGVDPLAEPAASTIAASDKRVRGAYLRRRADMEFVQGPADAYLGDELARKLAVGPGDRVVLTVSPARESRPSSAAFVVRGTFRTGLDELDAGYAEIPLEDAQQLLRLGRGVTQVAVLLSDLERSDAVAAALASSLGPGHELEVLSWKTALRELYEAIVLDDIGLYLMMAIIFVIVAIGIFNTVLMSVAERTREFGVMMAVGTSRGRLFSIVMAEAAVLAAIAAAIGLAIGVTLHAIIAARGIDVAALAGGDYEFAGIAWEGKVYSRLTPTVAIRWTLVVVAMVLSSAAYPAARAVRLEPVEAMRHV